MIGVETNFLRNQIIERCSNRGETLLPPGHPALEAFDFEQPSMFGIRKVHLEQDFAERLDLVRRLRRQRVEDAQIEGGRRPQHVDETQVDPSRSLLGLPHQASNHTSLCPSFVNRREHIEFTRLRIAVLANVAIERHQLHLTQVNAGLFQVVEGHDARLSGIARTDGERLAVQIRQLFHYDLATNQDLRARISIPIPHGDSNHLAVGAPFGAYMREARVPRDVDVPMQEGLELPLVVGEQCEIDDQAVRLEMLSHSFPKGDDLGVVRDGSNQQCRISHAVPVWRASGADGSIGTGADPRADRHNDSVFDTRSSRQASSFVAHRTLSALCLVACAAISSSASAQSAGEQAITAGEEPQAALAVPEISPAPDVAALVGKPVRRIEVVTSGTRFRDTARVESVRLGEPFGAEVSRRIMRELGKTSQFARISVEIFGEGDGVVVRVHVLPRRLVSAIVLAGATLDRSATLDAARIRDGGEITEPAIGEITERVRRYYAEHGHPKAKITADISETDVPGHVVLRLDIEPGIPRTIARRVFQVKPIMLREVGELPSKYRLGVGARIDEPLLDEADRDLTETLRENGFLRAQVEHEIRDTNNGAVLYVRLDPGPRIVPVFEGNHAIDQVELALTITQVKGLDLKTQDLIDKLVRFYADRGFLDANIKAEERGGPNDPVHHVVLTIDEGSRVQVAKRVFPCLPKSWNADQVGREIDTFLVEDLPGEKGFALRDPNAALSLFTQPSASRPVAKPIDLNPKSTYSPETYDRALKHLRDLAFSQGYLHAEIGPVSIARATCDPRSRAGECIPLTLPNVATRCSLDDGGLPVPEPEPPASATCRPDSLKHVECAREITLRIPMHLGPQTILYDVGFDGSRVFSEKQLFELSQLEPGKPLSTIALEAARLRLLDAYRNRGYAYAEVAAKIESSPDSTRARARFAITERDQVIVGGFVVRGAVRTSQELILRRLTLINGSPYVEREARTSEQRIGALGPFSSVSVGLEDPEVPQKQKRVIITVTEQPSQYLDPRVGFSTGEGLRFAAEYGHRNIAGLAIALTLRVQFAYLFDFIVLDPGVRADYEKKLSVAQQLERRNTISLNFPEVGFSPLWSFSIDGIDVRDNQRGFGISRQALVPALAYRPTRTITVRLSGSAEFNEIDVFNDTAIDSPLIPLLRYPKGQSFALAERVNFAWDGRNNAFAATKGGLVALGAEHVNAIPFGNNKAQINSHFLRLSGRASGYFEFTQKGPSIALSLAAGYNLQLNDTSETYPDRLFFLGGVDTIRAFLSDALVPEDVARGLVKEGQTTRGAVLASVPIRGGNLSINPRVELRVPLNDTFQTGFFLDAGNLWKEPSAIDYQLRYALGAGLRIITPVGPLALDYGVNLNRRQWEDFGAFHFSIGLF